MGIETENLSGTETILLVDDETYVRELARLHLETQGYKVLEARSCSEAILLFEHNKEAIQLLLTDVVMPKMSGRDLVNILTSARKNLKIVFMSGFIQSASVHRGIQSEGTPFLQKPFTRDALLRKVRETLDAGTVDPAAQNPI